MHNLLDLCSIVGYYAPQPELGRALVNINSPVVNTGYSPNALISPADPFNDPNNEVLIPELESSSSTPTNRVNSIQMMLDVNTKGSSATNESLSRFEVSPPT